MFVRNPHPVDLVRSVLGEATLKRFDGLYAPGELKMTELNMTELALRHSRYVNGVAQRHGDVTRKMFDGYDVRAITNGVHAATWTSRRCKSSSIGMCRVGARTIKAFAT